MHTPIKLHIDVTEAAGLGMSAHTAVTVHLPDAAALAEPPIVCFAFPGGGYRREYFSFDMPGVAGGGQAGWHVSRGWIFVACDQLGFGDATVPEGNALTLENTAAANHETVKEVMARLESSAILDGFPSMRGATKIGIGQSMGGCYTIVQQAHHQSFDAIAPLGSSAIHTVVPSRPGSPPLAWYWIPRGSDLDHPEILNHAAISAAAVPPITIQEWISDVGSQGENPMTWAFHYDDEPSEVVALDMSAARTTNASSLPPWRSATSPACGAFMVAPGAVALEAAAITVPVLIGVGERDVVPDPWMEPKAFKSSNDITIFVCPRMAHMHNFAGTRELLWQRIHSWATGVAQLCARSA